MNFATVKSITLPQGRAVKISQGNTLLWQAQPQEKPIVNLIDTVGVTDGVRLSSSSGSEKTQSGYFVTGSMAAQKGDVFRTSGADFDDGGSYAGVFGWKTGGAYWTYSYTKFSASPISNTAWDIVVDASGNLEITINSVDLTAIRLCGIGSADGLLVTKNQSMG